MGRQQFTVKTWNTLKSLIDSGEGDYVTFQVNDRPGNSYTLYARCLSDGRSQGYDTITRNECIGYDAVFQKHFGLKDLIANKQVLMITDAIAFKVYPLIKKEKIRVRGRNAMIQKNGRMRVFGTLNQGYPPFIRLCIDCTQESEIVSCTLQKLHEIDEDEVFGKICTGCHAPLAAWEQCAFCHEVYWKIELHTCAERRIYQNTFKGVMDPLDLIVTQFATNPVKDA